MSSVLNIPPLLYPDRTDSSLNSIRAAYRILGESQWVQFADAANFGLGRGASLVIAGPGGSIASGGSATYRYYVWPHVQNTNHVWFVSLARASGSTDSCAGGVTVPGGTAPYTWTLEENEPVLQGKTFAYQGNIDPADGSPRELAITISNDGPGVVQVMGICCYELPRVNLDSFAIKVPDSQSCQGKRPIFGDSGDENSINAVCTASKYALDNATRCALFSWCRPSGIAITAGSFPGSSNVFILNPSIVNRHLYFGQTSRDVAVAVYAKMVGSTPAGDVKITAATGASVTLHFTSTSAAWVTGTLTVETEDPTRWGTDGGLRGGSRETLRFEARKTAGTNITVYSACVGEPPP